MTGHTPGPWVWNGPAKESGDSEMSFYAGEKSIIGGCGCCGSPWGVSDENELAANARLISAAPELLEALQGALTILCDSVGGFDYDKAVAAVAKATQP